MKDKTLAQFVKLRDALQKEKLAVENRLAEINRAMGIVTAAPVSAAPVARRGRPAKVKKAAAAAPAPVAKAPAAKAAKPGKRGGWKRLKNAMSLGEAVAKVTAAKALTKQEILAAVIKLGYKFSTSNPMNRLGVVLYGKNSPFKNENGKFSPKK